MKGDGYRGSDESGSWEISVEEGGARSLELYLIFISVTGFLNFGWNTYSSVSSEFLFSLHVRSGMFT